MAEPPTGFSVSRIQTRSSPNIPDHTLLRLIGKGSYGEVWLARNAIGTLRAVKVIYRSSFSESRPYERELAGIRKFEPVSRSHDGLIDILQVGRNDADSYFYYVMELADPADPAAPEHEYRPKTLQDNSTRNVPMPLATSLPIFLSLASALGHLHKCGLVHRDIKPANVIFVKGLAKLADIGLVAEFSEARSYVGTEGFIPPEGPGTPAADIYSLGKLLYEVSTGLDRHDFPRLPLTADDLEQQRDLLELNAIVLKACASDPKLRYQSAEEILSDLALLQAGKSIRRIRQMERRMTRLSRYGVIGTAALCIAVAAFLFAQRRAQKERENAQRSAIAEKKATDELWKAHFAQAKIIRFSSAPGRRFESLAALHAAARIRPSLELRNEAIACLSLFDIRKIPFWQDFPPYPFPKNIMDPDLQTYVLEDRTNSCLRVFRVSDQALIETKPYPTNHIANGMLFSPSGRLFAFTTLEGLVNIWDTKQWRLRFSTNLPPNSLMALAFTPDEKVFAIPGPNKTLLFFDLQNQKHFPTVELSNDVDCLEFNPAGNKLAMLMDTQFQVLSWPECKVENSFQFAKRGFFDWHPSGKALVVATHAPDLIVLDLPTGKERRVKGYETGFSHVTCHPSGRFFATIGRDRITRFWEFQSGRELFAAENVSGIWFSRDGRQMWRRELAGFGLWDINDTCYSALRLPASGEFKEVHFSPDGNLLAATSEAGISLFDRQAQKTVTAEPMPEALSVAFSIDQKWLFASHRDGKRLLKWPLKKEVEYLSTPEKIRVPPPEYHLFRFSLSQDQKQVALARMSAVHIFPIDNTSSYVSITNLWSALSMAWHPKDPLLAVGTWQRNGTTVWDPRTGELIKNIGGQSAHVGFSPNGRQLVVGTAEDYQFWDVATWTLGPQIKRDAVSDQVGPFVFGSNGKLICVAKNRHYVQLIHLPDFEEIASFPIPDGRQITWITLSPDESQLAVGTTGDTIHIWNLRAVRSELAALGLDWPD
jgi:WD40 repeat protein